MTETVSIESTLPGLSGEIAAISYSGCCAIFLNGALIGNGALLWSGKHILTAARVVNGLTPSSNLTFQFDTSASYTVPAISAITIHPDYSVAGGVYDHNIALIEFSTTFSTVLERYRIEKIPDATMRQVIRRTYGKNVDPITGSIEGISPSYWISTTDQIGTAPCGVAIDSLGNIYQLALYAESAIDQTVLIKYSPYGEIVWQLSISDALHEATYFARDLSITSDDGVVICGSIQFSGTSSVVKISSSGTVGWATTLTGFSAFNPSTIHSDVSGDILVYGSCTVSSQMCMAQVLLNTSGTVVWSSYDQSSIIAITDGDCVIQGNYTYVAASVPGSSVSDFYLLKYSKSTGSFSSSSRRTSGTGYTSKLQAVCWDNAASLYAAGTATNTATNISYFYFTKFANYASPTWQKISTNSSSYNLLCDDIAADSSGVLATIAVQDTAAGTWNEIIASFDTNGNLLWQRLLAAPSTGIDTVRITIIDSASFAVTGETYDENWDVKVFTARLARDGSGAGTYGIYSYQSTSILAVTTSTAQSATAPSVRGATSGSQASGGAAAFSLSYTRYKDTIAAGSNNPTRAWKSIYDSYEASGFYHTYSSLSSYPITEAAQVVSDYDDGTYTRSTVGRKLSSEGTGLRAYPQLANIGFVNTDNYGAPAFIGANLAGVVGNILAETPPTYSITSTLGTYGTVAYDSYIYYYASYIEANVGAASPYSDLVPTPPLSPGLLRTSGPLSNPRPKYDPSIGTYIIQSGTSSSSLLVSNDYGKTWTTRAMPFTSGSGRAAYFYAIAKYGSRIVIAGERQIYTSDDNYATWVERFDAPASNQGPRNLTRHPYSGVWVAGGMGGRIHTSTDNGGTWTTIQLVANYEIPIYFHAPSATFVASSTYGVYTSTTGHTWVYRNISGGASFVGDIFYNLVPFEKVSVDGGATWVPFSVPCYAVGKGIKFYFLDGKYYAFRLGAADLPYIGISEDGISWRQSAGLDRFHSTVLSQGIHAVAAGAGLIVVLLNSGGTYFVSADSGETWTAYDFFAGDPNRLIYDIAYSESLDLWVVCGYDGFFAYSKDPRCSWKIESISDSSSTLAVINGICITPQSLVVYGSQDVWYIDAPSGAIVQPEPVYASKVTPIANSGLLGVVSGSTHFSGTLLQTGRHILTSAHAVVGITSGDYAAIDIIFNVDAAITIAPPTVIGITSHPSYSATPGTAGWINYDLAIIELAEVVDPRVSRYELYTGDEAMPRVFDKTGYGHAWDPVSGVAELDNLHFIAFQNRYESLGAPLQSLGIPYIASNLHLLYDYDNGSGLQDAIGDNAAFINQPSDLGLGANEGFTAPGRSGSAGLLAGKIAGVTFGTYSVAPYDINGGGNDATYGEIGIDIRISQFTGWIAEAADFGVDFTNTLAGLSAELEFSPPTGFRVDGELSTLTGEITAVLTPSLTMDVLVPGLDSDIALVSPWQVEATLTPLYGTIEIAACELFTAESTLSGFSADFELTPRVLIALENSLPGFGSQIELALSNRFSLQGLLGITSQIGLAPVDTFALSSVLPGIGVDLTAASGFYLASVLPGIRGDLQAESNSMSFAGYLAALRGSVAIDSGEFIVFSSLAGLKGVIAIGNQQYGIEGYLPTLRGGFTVTDAEIFKSEATLPGLMFDGLWRSFEISGELAGLRGSIRYDSAMCSTRYL